MTLNIITSVSHIDNSVYNFFEELDKEFVPPISKRTTIDKYINSIFENNGQLILLIDDLNIYGITGVVTNHPIWKNYIQYIAVLPTSRKKGISKILLSAAIELFQGQGAKSVMIRTWSTNTISATLFSCKPPFFSTTQK